MNEIGLFVSTFGGAGLFIVYLINREKTTTKEQIDEIKKIGSKIDRQADSVDDLSYLLLDFLDYNMPNYGDKRNIKNLKSRIETRQYERNKS